MGLCLILAAELSQEWVAMLCTERDEVDPACAVVPAWASAMGERYGAVV